MTIRTLLMLLAAFLFTTPAMAVIEKTNATATMTVQQNNKLKKDFKMEKRQEMSQKNLKRAGFKNPTQKWLLGWLISWILAGLLYFMALLATHSNVSVYYARFAWVALIVGIVFLIIWVVKKLA